jgi:hypothetical protein
METTTRYVSLGYNLQNMQTSPFLTVLVFNDVMFNLCYAPCFIYTMLLFVLTYA